MEDEFTSKSEPIAAKMRTVKQLSVFERLTGTIQKSLQFFQRKNPPETQLIGRIQELTRTSKDLLTELIAIKTELQMEVDPQFFSHIEAVVDPLIRDITRIHQTIDQEKNASPAAQVHFFRRYNDWIEKARNWIKLKKSHSDKQSIEEAIVKHLYDDFVEKIGRDLQVINDYEQHLIDSIEMPEELADGLRREIGIHLEPYISSLQALKKPPAHLSFKTLGSWKDNIDKRRQKYFDGALFVIDKSIQDYKPASEIKEEHEHLVEIFTQMSTLEEIVPELHKECSELDRSDDSLKERLMLKLEECEEGAERLNIDLRLTPELIDRLQAIIEELQEIRNLLTNGL